MRLRDLTFGAVTAIALVMSAPAAIAQEQVCEDAQFSAKTGQLYLDAENAYLGEPPNYEVARQKINQLKALELNCYERSAVVRLSAGINVQAGDYLAAVKDLEEALAGFSAEDKLTTYYQIAQLYLQLDNFPKAVEYLETWIAAGAKPDKNQNMQLATMYQKLGSNEMALKYLEDLLRQEPNPDKTVIDFAVYLYNETGQKVKLGDFLMNKVIPRFSTEKRYYEIVSGLWYEANEDRKAFEMVKAMYLAGMLTNESEIMRVVNFYNAFNAPYEAARLLEKEMNAGRIKESPEKLDTLANLYQVAREYDRAIPVIQKLAEETNTGRAYERLGRSYFELQKYEESEKALRKGLQLGGMKEPGFAWVLIGQMRHREEKREEARKAFKEAQKLGDRGGRGWLDFMDAEDETKVALARFEIQVQVDELRSLKKACEELEVLGGEPPEECKTVDERMAPLLAKLGVDEDGNPLPEDEETEEAALEDEETEESESDEG